MTTSKADLVYFPERVNLVSTEDIVLSRYIGNLPDYYVSPSENTFYGQFLRVSAEEQTRIEYLFQYNTVGYSAFNLTPPDLKRRYAAPLQINRSFPYPDQSDAYYYQLINTLLLAYSKGTTAQSIYNIVYAYTGYVTKVEELYKQIGNGIYDQSDRNALEVSVTPPNGDISSGVKVVTQDLYRAIDLAKPAHVGLSLVLKLGLSESFEPIISAITDDLTIIFEFAEEAPLENMFHEAPFLDSDTPESLLNSQGLVSPRINAVWEIVSEDFKTLDLD